MKINLILGTKTIKKSPYKLAHKYKPIMKKEIEGILATGIVYPIEALEWESHMVVLPKKHDLTKLCICIDYRGLNKLRITNPFPSPFTDEIINELMGLECYSFTDGFFDYNQVPRVEED